ncbi:MAG: type II toxin-antitoxin system RelE/ParE family toxin [Lewinellaceae bacterium]|nr:type II toxin-antitoxin system RelE/ParE family toxin [Saprospiraceae bacterium]MCB9338134.1 type II toxin-antitoxin system RelE/ParE family toxin [Lewinellaceae bacterium]
MAQATWSLQAIDDLSDLEDYLALSSKRHATLIVDAILDAVILLEKFPQLGRVVPEMNSPNLRELIIKKYRVVYYLNFHDQVEIVTIRHSSKPLGETPLPFG